MRGRGTRVRLARPLAFALLLCTAALLIPSSASAAATPSVPVRAPSPPPPDLAEGSLGSAGGYEPWYAAAVPNAVPATVRQEVVVVFQSRGAFEVGPAAGGPMTAQEFADQHGLSTSQYRDAEQYFLAAGLSIVHLWPDRLALSIAGPPVALDRAFSTALVAGIYEGRPVVFPASPPSLPVALGSEVAGVVGLSSGFDTFDLAGAQPGPGAASEVTPSVARSMYDLWALYNATGAAQYPSNLTIALLLWGEGYAPSDLASFYSQYYPSSLPTPKLAPDPVNGAPLPSDSALSSPDIRAVEELTLDLEWSGSMAPGATLAAVYAADGPAPGYNPSTVNMTDALESALSLPNVSVVSMSFGVAESGDFALATAWNSLLSGEAVDRGITIVAATGDLGGDAGTNCTGGPAPEYPSTDPYVLAVGGTQVSLTTNPLGMWTGAFSESAWGLGGGGYSSQFSEPSWQDSSQANGGRGTPDVSATAADNFLYFNGGPTSAEGTSFATPLWAGIVATMDAKWGRSLGFFNPNLYHVGESILGGSLPAGLADITSGGNCVVPVAGTGWDAATGWGTPRAVVLYYDLVGSFIDLTLSSTPSTVAPGGSISVSAQVANRTTGQPIGNTPVEISVGSDISLGPCTGTFGTASATTNSTGWVSVHLSVPYCYLGSRAVLSAVVTTAHLYGTAAATVTVSLLGFVPQLEAIEHAPWSYVGFVAIAGAALVVGGVLGRRPPPNRGVAALGSPPASPPATSTPSPWGGPNPPAPSAPPAEPGPPPSGTPADSETS